MRTFKQIFLEVLDEEQSNLNETIEYRKAIIRFGGKISKRIDEVLELEKEIGEEDE